MTLTEFKNRYFNFEGLVIFTFMSVFFPFYLTALVVIGFGFYILFNKKKRAEVFKEKYFLFFLIFSIYSLIVGAFNLNILGVLCSIFFFLVFLISAYFKNTIQKELYERGLTVMVYMGALTGILTFIEFIFKADILNPPLTYRAQLYFFNPNYLATLFSMAIIVCAYKVVCRKGSKLIYYICATLCGVGVYLTGSLFALVEIFIGVAAVLLLSKRHQMLSALLLLTATMCIVVYCMPEILPRLKQANITTENRVLIWLTSIDMIKSNIFFGGGYLTYFNIQNNYPGAYFTTHAHNIVLEPMLSFGIIGVVLLILFFTFFYKRVFICKNYQSKSKASVLILAVSIAALIHATTDMTLIWIQTAFMFSLILSGVGHEERLLKI